MTDTATPLRVLILEDLPDDAETLVRELRRARFDPDWVWVATEQDFLAHLDPTLDVILSDYFMSGFDGLQALRLLRERGLDIPFILVSGTVGEDFAVAAIHEGAADYLLKDHLGRLAPAITRALGEKRLRGEKRQVEQDLWESERRFRALVESSLDEIVDFNSQLKPIYISPSVLQASEYSLEELVEATPFTSIHPEDQPAARKLYEWLFQHPAQHKDFQLRLIRKDGSPRWTEGTAINLLNDPSVRGIVLNYRDITERKQAEEKLAASESKLRAVFAAMQDVVMVVDKDGVYREIAPTDPGLLVHPPEELLGRSLRDVFPTEQAEEFLGVIRNVVKGQEAFRIEYQLQIRETTVWFSAVVTPIGTDAAVWVARDITERKQAEKKIQQQLERLTALREIDQAISSTFDVRESLNVLLSRATTLLAVDAAAVWILNPGQYELEYGAGIGFRTNAIKNAGMRLGESYAGKVAVEGRIMQIPNPAVEPDNLFLTGSLKSEDFVSYYGAPLIVKGKVIGVLEVFNRSFIERNQDWLDFFRTLAGQAAIAIDNAELFNDLQTSNIELSLAYEATIEGWSRALDLRDKETEGHTQRVTHLTMELARRLGFSDDQLVHVRRGALLHDIGKMGVPDHILLKPAALTQDEWEIMKKHPVFAYEMLSPIRYLKSAALDIPYCHHEKWDGTGYPHGLKGEQIPLVARIFAVVDVWDAITSNRPYRAAWTKEKALEYIKEQSGKDFDPVVVKAFLRMIG